MADLRFGGSVWPNIEIALRAAEAVYQTETDALGLTVLEWYILRALYEQNGQIASQLAKAVGRQATSFTPVLDKLHAKGFIERQAHPTDRRSVKIYLSASGQDMQKAVEASAARIESQMRKRFSDREWRAYENAITILQTLEI